MKTSKCKGAAGERPRNATITNVPKPTTNSLLANNYIRKSSTEVRHTINRTTEGKREPLRINEQTAEAYVPVTHEN